MHIVGSIITLCMLVWWLSRAAKAAPDITSTGRAIANMPRRRRHAKAVNRKGLDLVETPIEAATVLMLAISRMSKDRRLSGAEKQEIERHLIRERAMERGDADGMILQMEIVHHDVAQPETALFPMVDILREHVSKDDARKLADMMMSVAKVDGETHPQRDFIRRYRERMGIDE